jgi:hypothetical protein
MTINVAPGCCVERACLPHYQLLLLKEKLVDGGLLNRGVFLKHTHTNTRTHHPTQ